MDLINFDSHFERFTVQWLKENAARVGGKIEKLEAMMPELYMRWINQPAVWLEGQTPALYFAGFDDGGLLVDWMADYARQGVAMPDLLLERITALGQQAEAPLCALLVDDQAPHEAVLTAVSLLREIGCPAPMALYITWIAQCKGADERVDMAAESLLSMGRTALPYLLSALDAATEAGKEVFLDLLCNYPGDERVFEFAMERFQTQATRQALFASYLGKLGDDRAIPVLREAAVRGDVNYLDFLEIRNAIEELGGDPPPERDFEGDPYWESLKQVNA